MKRTLQEWADFTGWYVAMDGEETFCLHEHMPSICSDSDEWNNKGEVWEIPIDLVDNDLPSWNWQDSLHSPRVVCSDCDGNEIK